MDTEKDNKNKVRVAVIDNFIEFRDMSVKQLENSGYTVLFQTGNGQDALQNIKENDRFPDVCIIEEDFSTAKLLLEKHPDLKILISSTEDDEESVTGMLKIGVSGYILKYADPDEIITAVDVLSGNRKYFSVGISPVVSKYLKNQSQS
ncbi:MAG TPA: response regulator transcription factor [Petrimonas sp.]|uniref:response regulator n=1 Tax=Petrimonas sp. TaxID=2023866 RepID=UPI00175CA6B0|nr:response regulator transcription factor [Petrimonas sp.]